MTPVLSEKDIYDECQTFHVFADHKIRNRAHEQNMQMAIASLCGHKNQ